VIKPYLSNGYVNSKINDIIYLQVNLNPLWGFKQKIYEEELPKIAKKFDPDIILVSAGYDLHQSDPLASLNVTTEGIKRIVKSILSLKRVPYLFMLEGGYELGALGENVKVTLEEMLVPYHT